jgi:hypothetical protein
MNVPMAIERALYAQIRKQPLAAGTRVRCWHNPALDPTWNKDNDRTLPFVELRCAAPRTSDDQATYTVTCTILCQTDPNDDTARQQINALELAAQTAIDNLFLQFHGASGSDWQEYAADVQGDCPGLEIGGCEIGDPLAPYDEGGNQAVGVSFITHYARP